jgi:hypothetical protein
LQILARRAFVASLLGPNQRGTAPRERDKKSHEHHSTFAAEQNLSIRYANSKQNQSKKKLLPKTFFEAITQCMGVELGRKKDKIFTPSTPKQYSSLAPSRPQWGGRGRSEREMRGREAGEVWTEGGGREGEDRARESPQRLTSSTPRRAKHSKTLQHKTKKTFNLKSRGNTVFAPVNTLVYSRRSNKGVAGHSALAIGEENGIVFPHPLRRKRKKGGKEVGNNMSRHARSQLCSRKMPPNSPPSSSSDPLHCSFACVMASGKVLGSNFFF